MKAILLISLFLTCTSTYAALSKWVDSNGKVHYSDQQPPANVKAKTLHSPPPSKPIAQKDGGENVPGAPKSVAEREADLKKAQQEKAAAAEKTGKEQANAEALKENCNAAQQNLRVLQEGVRVVEIDSAGERSEMNDERRQQKIAKAQKDIGQYCK